MTARATSPSRSSLRTEPELLARLLAQAKAPLKDAAAINATRWELLRRLEATWPAGRVRERWSN